MTTRVTGGVLRGRLLQTPDGDKVRPTSSRVRESIFSILGQQLRGLAVLDVCAGAGTLGIEAASRGAEHVVFVEQDRRHASLLLANSQLIEGLAESRVLTAPAARALPRLVAEGLRFDLVFIDPPYAEASTIVAALSDSTSMLLKDGGTLLVETSAGTCLPEELGDLVKQDQRKYGRTAVTIYGKEA